MLSLFASSSLAYNERGILKLDNTSFDRVIDGARGVFVRFDKEYAYGDEHDAWKDYAKTVGESSADLLTCDVGISEYGDKDNSDLADRFGIKPEDFPTYRLWKKGQGSRETPISFSGEKKAESFLKFVQDKSGSWIGLPGQIKAMDGFARELMNGGDAKALLAKAEAEASASSDETAKYYVKVMGKVPGDADFIAKETTRLQKMMDDGSVKPAKKEQFGRRLNVLTSFA